MPRSPTDEKKITKQESKSEVKEPCKKEEDDDDDEEDGDPNESKTEDAEVRDVRYKLENPNCNLIYIGSCIYLNLNRLGWQCDIWT